MILLNGYITSGFLINATDNQVPVVNNPAYETMTIGEVKLQANSVYDLTTPTVQDHHYDYIGLHAAAKPHPQVEEDCDVKKSHMYEDVSKICH